MANLPFSNAHSGTAGTVTGNTLVVVPLINLLQNMLAAHERLLVLAQKRFEAVQTYDLGQLNTMLAREQQEALGLQTMEQERKNIVAGFKRIPGLAGNPSVSQIAALCPEPTRTQLLVLSGKLKEVVVQLNRWNRINAKVISGVSASISKTLGILTGVAPHAGVYLANGRKARVKGIHMIDAVA